MGSGVLSEEQAKGFDETYCCPDYREFESCPEPHLAAVSAYPDLGPSMNISISIIIPMR